ncbi:MAG TPA: P-II family nitrogen regulator [Acidimicrobiia bacterium]|jgi:nitrogen regulatory protein P-II 1|nr:P-II family nitrogen regulator [Acidimicrobiia bacterium]
MKLIIAVIKPFKIDEVTDALNEIGISGITISEVRGHGRQKGHTEVYRGAEYHIAYIPKLRLELVVDDADADRIVTAIMDNARTGTIGDGKFWILPIETLGRIRTGELGSDAL